MRTRQLTLLGERLPGLPPCHWLSRRQVPIPSVDQLRLWAWMARLPPNAMLGHACAGAESRNFSNGLLSDNIHCLHFGLLC